MQLIMFTQQIGKKSPAASSIDTEKNTMRMLTTLSSKILWGEKAYMFISNYGHRNHHYTKLKHFTPCFSHCSALQNNWVVSYSKYTCFRKVAVTKPHTSQTQRCPWERALTAKPYDLRYQMGDNSCVLLRASSCHIDDASCNLNIVIDRWLHFIPSSVGRLGGSVGRRFMVRESNTNPLFAKEPKQPQTSLSTGLNFQKTGHININSWFFFSFKGYYSDKVDFLIQHMELVRCLVGWIFFSF